MRASAEIIVYPEPGGGEIIAVYYVGWNLAAAALGAINSLAEPARVGTSVAHDDLEPKKGDARQQLVPWEAGWSPHTDLDGLRSLRACCHPALAFHSMSHCLILLLSMNASLSCKATLFL